MPARSINFQRKNEMTETTAAMRKDGPTSNIGTLDAKSGRRTIQTCPSSEEFEGTKPVVR
jgi:hypothetical protein